MSNATVLPIPIKTVSARMRTAAAQQPPAGLRGEAKRLWSHVFAGWALEPPALVILETYCQALMRKHQARRLIARHGLLVKDRFGQLRANPAAAIERDADATMIRACRALKLDLEPLRDGPGRPGRED